MAKSNSYKQPEIKKSEEGSLKKIAKREGGLKSNGEINKTWARKKISNPRTSASTKKKLNFYLNFNK